MILLHEKGQEGFDICNASGYVFEYSFGEEIYGVLRTSSEHDSTNQ